MSDPDWFKDLEQGKVVDIVGKLKYGQPANPVIRQQEWWMPRWTYLNAPRLIACGGSGSGKTVAILCAVLNWLDFDTLIVCAGDIEEPKYDFLREWCKQTAGEIEAENEEIERLNRNRRGKDKLLLKQPLRYLFIDRIELLPDIRLWNTADKVAAEGAAEIPEVKDNDGKPMMLEKYKDRRTLVIVDDMINESYQGNVSNMFIRGRKRDIMVMYLAHSFFKIPEMMRKNSNSYIFFGGINKRNALDIAKGIETNLDPQEFVEVYLDATDDEGDENSNNFLYIDNTAKKRFRIRRNFNEVLIT